MDPRELNISGTVFTFGCLVLTIIGLVVGAGGLAFGMHATGVAAQTGAEVIKTSTAVQKCELDKAYLNGRVVAFENLLISTQRTAIDSSLRLFEIEIGKPVATASLKEYSSWLSRK